MQIAFFLFDEVTALDLVGPYDVLKLIPETEVVLVAREPGPKRAAGGLVLQAERALAEVRSPDVVVVPGGVGIRDLLDDGDLLAWLRQVNESSRWTTSVCTGSLLLGAAGLLHERKATTHWCALEELAAYGATPVSERVVEDGKIITAAGVSAGIDMALVLTAKLGGRRMAKVVQLAIEYDPQPPFDAGTPAKAGPDIVAILDR
jgi:transcriptional regulator GlxA family with amidase domain